MSDIDTTQPIARTAVEVVATFGDSVVGVKHVIDPRGGRTRTATRALLVGGALALAGALGGFAYAAHVASDNARAKEEMIAKGRPEWAFRPHMLPHAADVAFALAGSLGIAALVWGLARRRDEKRDPRVRIGTAAGVDFAAPALACADDERSESNGVGALPASPVGRGRSPRGIDHALVAPIGDGFVLRLGGGLTADGISAPELPIFQGTHARVRCGAMTFHVSGVPAPKRQPTPIFAAIDRRVASYFAGSLVAHAALLMLIRAIPPDPDNVNADLATSEVGDIVARLPSQDEARPTPTDGPTDGGNTAPGANNALAMNTAPGTIGAPGQHSDNPARLKSTGDVTRDAAIENARRAGVLTIIDPNAMAGLIGPDGENAGPDDYEQLGIYGGDDNGDGAPDGSFGRGHHGPGTGGDSVFAGDYRTIPGGGGDGRDFTLNPGGGHCPAGHICKQRTSVPPPVKIGPPTGDIDVAAVVQRYIKRYRDRIGYCYEKELLGKPGLEGTVNVTFLLGADGHVMSAQADGVDGAVSSCIQGVVSAIEFPRLADSGTFQIKYPFILHAPAAASN